MDLCVVWVDQQMAKLFHFSEDRMERETLPGAPLYDEIAKKVSQAKRVLILGPGDTRSHLHDRIKEKFPVIAMRIVGCEGSDHSTDHHIATYAMKYFQKPVA